MPKEVHYVLFSVDELRKSLCDYANTHAGAGSDRYDSVERFSLRKMPEGGIGAHVILKKHGSDASLDREFVASDIVTALLLSCRTHAIPVAQRAHKVAESFGDNQVALMMTVDFPKTDPIVTGHDVLYSGSDAEEGKTRVRAG
jgi:hypothetical protein